MSSPKRTIAHAPRPTLAAPASARPRLKRLNVDLVEADHRELKLWAAGAGVDTSALVRAMLELTRREPAWRETVEDLAQALVEGGRGARPGGRGVGLRCSVSTPIPASSPSWPYRPCGARRAAPTW